MKKILTLAAAAALLASCGNKNGYVIEGTIEGLDGMVYLLDEERNPIDSATVENGTFRLTGTADKPSIMTLCDAPDETATFYAGLFIEPGTITVADDAENPMRKRVTGTPANDANAALTAASAALIDEVRNPETTDERRAAIEKEYEELIRSTYEANITNYFGALILAQQLSYELSGQELLDEIARFSPELQQTGILTELKQSAEQKAKTDIGQPYIDFEQPDADGKNISLKSVVENPANKYVLLDFWASWCGPCMGEVPHLKKTYDEFHKKGFEIFGVSLDRDRDKWLDAVKQNNMNWIHVSSLDAFGNAAAEAYAVQAIPTNLLIDAEGKIVAKNLRGEELYEKIAELLK